MKHKEPEVRKNEILDAAQKLFIEKGYAKSTVSDILSVGGLSKGVFYYYYKSKEEVMDAVIERIVDATVKGAQEIMANPALSVSGKICAILLRQGQSKESIQTKQDMIEQFRAAENAEMHQRSMVRTIRRLAPIMAPLFQQDADGNPLSTEYPKETMGLLLAAGHFIFDEGLFSWSREERAHHASAFIEMMSKTLGVEPEYFNDVKKILE